MTTLIIARHGNTFEKDETPRRVGARTDLPLTETGREQARALGQYLKNNELIPDMVFSSGLKRAAETASLAVKETAVPNPVYTLDIFNEIDYGPDENKTEAEVIARIGAAALKNWEDFATAPPGWTPHPDTIIANWRGFAQQISDGEEEVVLVVTSNGTARFAPHITGDFEAFRKTHPLKLATGALGILQNHNGAWTVKDWNIRPLTS